MTLRDLMTEGISRLGVLYPAEEARAIMTRLCSERLGVESYRYVTEPGMEVSDTLEDDLRRLSDGEPLQYVLGYADFCGRRFRVTPDVLIPRPETEGLVELVLKAPGDRVLDLCTGSGCIAWSLALKGRTVVGVDVSAAALEIARRQESGGTGVKFVECSIMDEPCFKRGSFDIVVSNPPYILESQKAGMARNVLEHEPPIALFVPDDDPLVFYRRVAEWAGMCLRRRGRGFVEINDALGPETAALFADCGFEKIVLLKDLSGRDRYVKFEK